jgi:flagellar motor switch protein FliG
MPAVSDDAARLSGKRKVAALLIALGAERAAPIVKQLSEADLEDVTREIVRIERMPLAMREEILAQAYQDAASRGSAGTSAGGADFAREMLGRTLPSQRASEMLARASGGTSKRPFAFIAELDPNQVAAILGTEHPQTIALVLSHLSPDVSGRLIVAFDPELRADVTTRLAVMSRTSPERVREVEQVLRRKLAALEQSGLRAGGLEQVVGILSTLDSRSERAILEGLAEKDPELADALRKQMFVFDDIKLLDDRSIRRLLQDVRKDLPLALRTASQELQGRIYDNMSSRAREELQREIALRGPARVRDIEDAQARIVETARKLAENEEIHISRGREDVFI